MENTTRKTRSDKGRHFTHCRRGHEFTPENTYVTTQRNYRCRICIQKNRDESKWDSKTYDKEYSLIEKGWTIDSFNKAFEKQEGKCAVCGKVMNLDKKPNSDRACADHDHGTNKPRSVLCAACNFGLGCLQDSLEVVEKAAAYLRRYK